VIKILLEAKADPTLKDKRGFTALSIAQGQSDDELVRILSASPVSESN
jgi:hypothetical protein